MRFQWQKLTQYSQKTRIDGKEYFADAVVLGGWEICSASGKVLFYHESLTTAKAQFAKLMNAPMVDQPAQNVVTLKPRNCNKEDFEPAPTAIPMQIVAIADAYLEAVDPAELDELIQLQADKERAQQEIIEAAESITRPNALANRGQLREITTWIAKHAPHAEKNWFPRFTRLLFGASVAMNQLTTSQAELVMASLRHLNNTRSYPREWNMATVHLMIYYKYDLNYDDLDRAGKECAACEQKFCYDVSLGRTNDTRCLTHDEAGGFVALVNALVPTVPAH